MRLTKYITIAAMLVMLSCSEQIEPEPLTYPKMFTGETKKAWSLRNVQLLRTGSGTQTFSLDPCVLNDLYVFYNNPEKTMQILEGASACNEGDPAVVAESSWSFVNATATLSMPMPLLTAPPYEPLPFILKEVDDTKLVIDIYFLDKITHYRFNFRAASVE